MKCVFQIQNLASLDDGRVVAGINLAIAQAVRDCVSRPGDKAARKVSLGITMKPEPGDDGVCETASLEFDIKTSLPVKRSKTYQMGTNGNGSLTFNDASPSDVRQGTLDETEAFNKESQ